MLLENKVALITGGTGAVGEKLCEVLSREGADIVFNYTQDNEKAENVLEIIRKNNRKGLSIKCSVTDAHAVEEMVSRAIELFAHIDILVNNAGITQVLPFALIEEEDWDQMMAINVKGTFLVTREVVRHMIAAQSGIIISIGSIASLRMLEVPVHYAASKGALCGFTISLAKELSRYNIRVNSVMPGMLESGVSSNVPEKKYKEYIKYCAAGRAGKPEEVAELVAFLCSEKASYINAQNIVIDGGL